MKRIRRRIRGLAPYELTGARIRFLRFEHGLTQRELAKMIGVQQSHLSEAETGSHFAGWRILWSVSELFNVSLDWLIEPSDHGSGKRFRVQSRPEWMIHTQLPA